MGTETGSQAPGRRKEEALKKKTRYNGD